ncbi:MAG: hypothetical protein FWC78_03160 [Defluviitaleaceae bacterium]|nr:hypothetical protein [Defluviitaleaceae bacterium]
MSDEKLLRNLAKQYVNEAGKAYQRENAAIDHAPIPTLDTKMAAARRRHRARFMRGFVGIAASVLVLVVVGVTVLPQFLRDEMLDRMPLLAPETAAPAAAQADSIYGAGDMGYGFGDVAAMEESWEPTHWGDAIAGAAPNDGVFGAATSDDTSPELWAAQPGGGLADEQPMAAAIPAPAIARVFLAPPAGWQIVYTDFDGEKTIFHLENDIQNSVVVIASLPPETSDFSQFFPVLINYQRAFMKIDSYFSVLIYHQDGLQFTLTTPHDYADLLVLAGAWI